MKPCCGCRRAVEAVNAPGAAEAEQQSTTATFWLQYHVEWGQRLRVIGSHPALGGPPSCWRHLSWCCEPDTSCRGDETSAT